MMDAMPVDRPDRSRVLVVGDANPDLVLTGDVVPRFGQVEQLLDSATLTIGGSAGITAHALARLGRPVSLVAAVGTDLLRRPDLRTTSPRRVSAWTHAASTRRGRPG